MSSKMLTISSNPNNILKVENYLRDAQQLSIMLSSMAIMQTKVKMWLSIWKSNLAD